MIEQSQTQRDDHASTPFDICATVVHPTTRRTARRIVATLALTIGSALLATACGGGLSEDSTCKDYLAASADQQQSIVMQLAGKYDKPDYATPLGMPQVAYSCAALPDTTLGEYFKTRS